jgi:DNA-directed RNA polymerase subunit RPC12/RpoP
MSNSARDLLVRGIAAAKAGEGDEARHYLEWALRQEPSSDQQIEAWLWLSQVAREKDEARRWVEEVLAADTHNPRALRRLALLDGRLRPSELIDPDHLPATASTEEPIAVERFACPSCGGQMAYAPDGDGLQCDHCGHRLNVLSGGQGPEPAADDFILALATVRGHSSPQASPTFTCGACGARFLLAPETLSITCPYCDATYAVEENDEHLLIAPQAIVPLMVSLDDARRSLVGWMGQRAGGEPFTIGRLTAAYLPLWLFEMGGVIEWSALHAGSAWGGEGDPLSGAEPPVSPIAVLACSNRRPGFATAVECVDPRLLVPFDVAYLAARPAETYTLSIADAALRARQRAMLLTGEKLKAGSGGVRLSLRSARMVVTAYTLALVPVWLADVDVGESTRRLVVSGVTAEVCDDSRPAVSKTETFSRPGRAIQPGDSGTS